MTAGFQHVPETQVELESVCWRVGQEEMFMEDKWNLLEKVVLGFSVELIDAQLQHLQTSGSLWTQKEILKEYLL